MYLMLGPRPRARPTPAAEALLAFKAGLDNPTGALASWQPDTNPCSAAQPWAGVGCDGGGRVVAVALEGAGLRGPLAGALAGVERLREVQLAGNQLTGG